MDWVTQVLCFGFLAFLMFILSAVFAWKGKIGIGLLFAGLELLSAAISSMGWMYALLISGKTDWFLLGFVGYRPVSLIFISMFIVGIGCVAVNLWMCYKRSAATNPAVQA